jgi:hypothetical protein
MNVQEHPVFGRVRGDHPLGMHSVYRHILPGNALRKLHFLRASVHAVAKCAHIESLVNDFWPELAGKQVPVPQCPDKQLTFYTLHRFGFDLRLNDFVHCSKITVRQFFTPQTYTFFDSIKQMPRVFS